MPETNPTNTLIISYDQGHYADSHLEILSKLDDNINVIVTVVDNQSPENHPKMFQEFKKIKNVTLVELKNYQGNVWARDWIPQKVIRSDGSVQYVNLKYYAITNSHLAASHFAEHFKLPHYESWIKGEMGNIMTDGKGRLFTTKKMITEELKKAFEVNEVYYIPEHPKDGSIGHIDLVAKYVGQIDGKETVLVSDSIQPVVKQELDKTARIFKKLGYKVVRIEEFEEKIGKGAAGFVNSLILNNRVFMPTYSKGFSNPPTRLLQLEENARLTYQKLGYKVFEVDSSKPIKGMGAVHCLTCTVELKPQD